MTGLETFVTGVSLASAFATGRDVNKNTSLLDFLTYLVNQGQQELSESIKQSSMTSVYIKAVLNAQLPLVIQTLEEVSLSQKELPLTLKSLFDAQEDSRHKAAVILEAKLDEAIAARSSVTQSSSGDRSPNITNFGNGSTHINNSDKIINNYGISLEDHGERLRAREKEIKAELFKSNPSDRIIREVLEKELNELTCQLQNLEASHKEVVVSREKTSRTLQTIRESLPGFKTDEAQRELEAGNTFFAKKLFDDVILQADEVCKLAGKAAYENGRMAENEIRYFEAKEYYSKAIKYQSETVRYITAIASIHHKLGSYDTAIEYIEQALIIDMKAFGEDHPNVSAHRNGLAEAWREKGYFNKALEYFELILMSDLRSVRDYCIAFDYDKIGSVQIAMGQYDKAIVNCNLALIHYKKTSSADSSEVATVHNNLGSAFLRKGEFGEAIGYFKQTLISDLNNFGEDHPRVATDYNNLGSAWEAEGDYKKASQYYELALKSNLKTFGEDHPTVAIVLYNLGSALIGKGEYEKAIAYINRALKIDLKIFDEEHPSVAADRHLLGFALGSQSNFKQALVQLELALSIRTKKLGEQHPSTQDTLMWVSIAKEKLWQSSVSVE